MDIIVKKIEETTVNYFSLLSFEQFSLIFSLVK